MGLYNLTNVPRASAKNLHIGWAVKGEMVHILCTVNQNTKEWPDGQGVSMTSVLVGDHMFSNPEALRQMYASDLVTAIQLARDAGYEQARAEIREALGVKGL